MPSINSKFIKKSEQLECVITALKRNHDIGWCPQHQESERFVYLWTSVQGNKKRNGSKTVYCKLCSKFFKTDLSSSRLLEHVSSFHLGLKLFSCRFCDYSIKRSNNFLRFHTKEKHPDEAAHLRLAHTKYTRKPYIDSSDKYHDTIMGMIKTCYDYDD